MNSKRTNNGNIALLLEPAHGFEQTINYNSLKSAHFFKKMGIKHVSVLLEEPFDEPCSIAKVISLSDKSFKGYIGSFILAGIPVSVVGLDKGKIPEPAPEKERIKDPEAYRVNFNGPKII